MDLYAISLFAGVGGLDLGVELASGSRVVCYVERESFSASILAARMRDGAIADAPIWSDVTTFDARRWRGCVDLVTGGFPCQDISVAGLGAGLDGERSGLWSEVVRVYRDSGARWLFVENVSALLIRGLDRVLADLAALGCDAEWTTLRASDVGAPHRRERLFLLARRVSDLDGEFVREHEGHAEPRGMGAHVMADCDSDGRESEQKAFRNDANRCGAHVAHASGVGSGSQLRRTGAPFDGSNARTTDFAFPPASNGDWSAIERHLHPAIEPGFRVVADGASLVVDAAQAGQLRALGNGVVPLQAAVAFRELWGRLREGD